MNRDPSKKFGGIVASARPLTAPGCTPYSGAELSRCNLRAGSYDAAALPSVMGSKRLTLAEMKAQRLGPIPSPLTLETAS